MRILIIGSNNVIAKKLIDFNTDEYVFSLLKNTEDLPWRFGDKCGISDFNKVDRIVFLAWSKSDLNLSLQSLKYILQFNQNLPVPIKLLFISSYSIFGETRYGMSKLFGEEIVNSYGGKFIRSPLIVDNKETFELSKLINFVKVFKTLPSNAVWGGEFEILPLSRLIFEIDFWIKNPDLFKSPGLLQSPLDVISVRDLLTNFDIHNVKEYRIVDWIAKILFNFITIWGSKSRTLDSTLSFYSQRKEIKSQYRSLSV